MSGQQISRAGIADMIENNGWGAVDLDLTTGATNLADEQTGARNIASRVERLIRSRSMVLGALYPFELRGQKLAVRNGFDLDESPYVALLAICMLHAWGISASVNVELAFERLVARSMTARGIPATQVGTSMSGTFVTRLETAASLLGLRADATAAARAVFAQDEGVDVLASNVWPDQRAGQWIWLGQATCASSDKWKAKITEPSPKQWEKFLLESIRPAAFLAVPHHVDDRVFEWLLQKGNDATVLDRLRLVLSGADLVQEDRSIIMDLRAVPVEAVAA